MSELYEQSIRWRPYRQRQKGFTLLELMVTLVIGGILLSLAIPNLRTYVANTRITTTTNEMLATINVARTEAIKRGASVLLCKSSDVDPETPTNSSCDSNAQSHWHQGWLLYAAPSANTPTNFNTGSGAPTDTTPLILASDSVDSGITVISNAAGTGFLHFDQRGFLRNNNMAVLAICDDRGEDAGRVIEISRLGRTSIHATSTSNTSRSCTPG